MRHVFGAVGVIAALILLGVSAAMNWQFGYSLGKTEFDSHIFGAASIAADGMKALMPFFIFSAWRQRNYPQALGATALWAVCILYAMTSALGFSALNRSDTSGARAIQHEKYEDLRAELNNVNQQSSWLEKHRPVGTVASEIEAAKQNVRWTTSEGCTNATVDKSREFCENFHKLGSELAIAKQADALSKRADEVRAKLAALNNGTVVAKVADPQAAILSTLSGFDISRIDVMLTILLTALVELGSSLGLYVSTSTWRMHELTRRPAPEPVKVVEIIRPAAAAAPVTASPEPAQIAAPKTDIEQYFDDRIRQDDGSSVTALALYDNYCEWCETNRKQPVGLPIFSRQLTDLGVQKAKIAGKIRYIGIRIAGGVAEDDGADVAAVS